MGREPLLTRPSFYNAAFRSFQLAVHPELSRLERLLSRWPRALLLFSGGLDSSLLLAVGARVLGSGLTALTCTGPHTAPGELAYAVRLARRFRVRHLVRPFDPLGLPDFAGNSRRRCYACKQALILLAQREAQELGAGVVWDGSNVDDLSDFRPGLDAVREAGVVSPLLEAGWGKAAIREASRTLGLNAHRPPQSCLATRFPYGAALTREALAAVGRAEAWLAARGFRRVRLRVTGDGVRLELPPEDWPAFLAPQVRRPFQGLLAALGFGPLELDSR
ncbi:MAG: TIGR00268 family protein [Deltaproteobacteria bacterium]|nr:TIGR00268 family protein [Deltaproteobacteria bacterium]